MIPVRERLRAALDAVYMGAGDSEADALLDQLEAQGLMLVCSSCGGPSLVRDAGHVVTLGDGGSVAGDNAPHHVWSVDAEPLHPNGRDSTEWVARCTCGWTDILEWRVYAEHAGRRHTLEATHGPL